MVEWIIITALVSWSAFVVFKKVFPKTAYAVFSRAARGCDQRGWPRLAKWLQPAMTAGCAGGCGCSTSDTPSAKKVEVQSVKWR